MRALLSKRALAQFTGLLAAVATSGVMIGTVGVVPAAAATCATPAHVYANGGHIKTEFQPIDGPVDDLVVPFGGIIHFGGNGLTPDEDPFWNIYREVDGAHMSTRMGNRTGDNCVSNERAHAMNHPRGSYLVRATYYRGNTGGTIEGQRHFRLVIV